MDSDRKTGNLFYWISAGRLVFLVLILGASYLLPGEGRFPLENFTRLSWVLGSAFMVSALSNLWYRQKGLETLVIWFQILADLTLVTLAVAWSGGPESPFTFLYPLAIIIACLLERHKGGAIAALLSTILYAGVCIWARPPFTLLEELAFNFFVNMAAFNATALLGMVLAGRLSRVEKRLSEVQVDLNRMEQLHTLVANSLTAGLVTTDGQGTITSFNKAAEELLGTGLSGRGDMDLRDIWKDASELLRGLGNDPGAKRLEMHYTAPDGRRRLFGVSTFLLKDERGKGLGCGMIFQDITDIKAREEQRQRRERLAALGEMAAGLAHEIRNPLASMSGAAQFLSESGMVLPEGERLIRIILRESTRLNQLTESFLKYARPGQGRPADLRLNQTVNELVEGIGSGNDAGSPDIEVDVPGDIEVCLDPAQLKQVLAQVLDNAIRAAGPGGRVSITARQEGDRTRIEIVDNGPGMEPHVLSRAFNPFFTTRPDGTGLGLSVVHQLTRAWGGEVFLESEPGRGCKAVITIPCKFFCPPSGSRIY